jgi:hypothetical protein
VECRCPKRVKKNVDSSLKIPELSATEERKEKEEAHIFIYGKQLFPRSDGVTKKFLFPSSEFIRHLVIDGFAGRFERDVLEAQCVVLGYEQRLGSELLGMVGQGLIFMSEGEGGEDKIYTIDKIGRLGRVFMFFEMLQVDEWTLGKQEIRS